MRPRLGLVLLPLLAAVAAASAAGAAPGKPVLSTSASRFPDRVYALTLPTKKKLTTADVTVTENGQTVNNLAVTPPGAAGFTTMLVIDASNSMRGTPIVDAMKAARAFNEQKNAATKLGIVFFSKRATVALAPTRDTAAISRALATVPKTHEGTRIYDALSTAADQLRATGAVAGSIVLLTDGADVGSTVTQEQALDRMAGVRARVFGVGLPSEAFTPSTLQALSSATGGAYSEASSSGGLAGIFGQLGFKLSNEYLLLYRSLAGPKKKVNVAIRVRGYPRVITTSYTTPALGINPQPFKRSFLGKIFVSWPFMFLVVVLAVSLVFWGIRTVATARQRTLRARMEQFIDVGTPGAGPLSAQDLRLRLERLGARLESRRWLQRFAEKCEIGEVQTSPSLLLFGSAFGGLVVGILLSTAISPVALLLVVLAPAAVLLWVSRRARIMQRRFGEQLPDSLEVLASALRAGHSLLGGLATMTDAAPEPLRREFRRVLADEQLGVPLDESLKRVGRRMENMDMNQVALIALLQRETGSSSAEVIDQVTANIRGRMEVRRLVWTLTAQGRLARWIVSLIPVALVCAILLIYPAFLHPLFHETVGVVALIVAAIMVVAGSLVIKRIVEIKV